MGTKDDTAAADRMQGRGSRQLSMGKINDDLLSKAPGSLANLNSPESVNSIDGGGKVSHSGLAESGPANFFLLVSVREHLLLLWICFYTLSS